jgi:hypothetical protein
MKKCRDYDLYSSKTIATLNRGRTIIRAVKIPVAGQIHGHSPNPGLLQSGLQVQAKVQRQPHTLHNI